MCLPEKNPESPVARAHRLRNGRTQWWCVRRHERLSWLTTLPAFARGSTSSFGGTTSGIHSGIASRAGLGPASLRGSGRNVLLHPPPEDASLEDEHEDEPALGSIPSALDIWGNLPDSPRLDRFPQTREGC